VAGGPPFVSLGRNPETPFTESGPQAPAAALAPEAPPAGEEASEDLRRARSLMTPASTGIHHLLAGRLDLLTDVRKAGCVDDLARATGRFAAAFGERYRIAMGARIKWTVAFFDSEAACLAFRGPEPDGPEDRQIAVVCGGSRGPEEIRRELARDMARIATHAKITATPPPWLDEGIASDFAERESSDKGTVVRLVRDAARAGRCLALPDVVGSNRKEFFAPGARELNVALSGLFVRFLLEGDGGAHAVAFREFLNDVASGGAPRSDALLARAGTDREDMQRGFDAWLGTLAAPAGFQ
jgi:hypothetical protein